MLKKTYFIRPLLLLLLLLSLAGQVLAAGPVTITVFYTSDTHGSIFTEKNVIGLDLLATLKKAAPDSILLDAGIPYPTGVCAPAL